MSLRCAGVMPLLVTMRVLERLTQSVSFSLVKTVSSSIIVLLNYTWHDNPSRLPATFSFLFLLRRLTLECYLLPVSVGKQVRQLVLTAYFYARVVGGIYLSAFYALHNLCREGGEDALDV